MKKIIFLFILCTLGMSAQESQLRNAEKSFSAASYDKSAELYTILIKEGNTDVLVLKRAADSYYFISDFEKAEPLYKKLINEYKDIVEEKYIFRYAQTLKALNKLNESDTLMQGYEKKVPETVYKSTIEKLENIRKQGNKFEIKNLPLNTKYSDFAPTFFKDKLVFATPAKDINIFTKKYHWTKQPYLDLYSARIEKNEVDSIPTPFSKKINTKLHEANATFTKDGKTMYFTRNNSNKNGKRQKDKRKITHLGIYKAQFINGEWTNVKSVFFNSQKYSTMHPTLNKENNILYFSSDMPGSIGSFDIFYVSIDENGNLGTPVNLGPEINTRNREQFPFISDKNILYFSSNGHLGFGQLDVYMSEFKNGTFTKPLNIGLPVNTNADDFSFIIDENNKKGFFASNRTDGKGDDDIYSFNQIIKVENFQYKVKGLIKDSETKAIINQVLIGLYDENETKIAEKKLEENGEFEFNIEKTGTYKLTTTQPNYIPAEKTFTILDNGITINEQIIKMQPIPKTFLEELIAEKEDPKVITDNGVLMFELPLILFDYNKYDVREDSKIHLDKLVAKLKHYPQIKIEIGAHTDIRGTEKYNIKLSQERANATKQYIVDQGISSNRIVGIGFGEGKPKVNCLDHECTEIEHQINRRCEFVIVISPDSK
jgi:outer membrane protein OmpA-like peptidoglycan-associated protein